MSKLEAGRNPDLIEVIRTAMDVLKNEMFVALPGKVEKYNATLQKADVKPLIKRPFVNDDGTEGLDELAVLPDVPVVFPRGGGYFLSLPLQAGDNVLLVFNDVSIDLFTASSGAVDIDPVDLRAHDISDAVAIPGFFSFPRSIKDVIASGAAFGKEKGVMIRATGNAMEVVTKGAPTASDYVALAAKVDALWAALYQVIVVDWTVVAQDGGAAFKAAFIAEFTTPPASVASTNLKAD